jgi:hypothetical protein
MAHLPRLSLREAGHQVTTECAQCHRHQLWRVPPPLYGVAAIDDPQSQNWRTVDDPASRAGTRVIRR